MQTHLAAEYFAQAFPDLVDRAHIFPRIFFPGFHPDNATVRSEAGPINGQPFGPYHSKIIVSAFVRGLPVERAVSLFNRGTYERLGYLDAYDEAWTQLREDCQRIDVDMKQAFGRWQRAGCFMYTVNHPHLHILSDVAHAMLRSICVDPRTDRAERHAHDDLRRSFVLPVFPELAERIGGAGDYVFKLPHQWGHDAQTLTLEEFAERSYAAYAPLGELSADRFDVNTFLDNALGERGHGIKSARVPTPHEPDRENPYSALPPEQVWRLAVADVAHGDVDPVAAVKFTLARGDKVATFGSCFAQHISQRLQRAGLGYYVTEQAPADLAPADALARSFGVFSARYGNLYTARQFAQLIERAYDPSAHTEPGWTRPDGRVADPFRPMIEPDGFASEADMQASRAAHLASVRELVEGMDVLVFTLGLTEAWRSRATGAVFPVAPGVAAGAWDRERFEFVNFTAREVVADTMAALERVRSVNPRARTILTVSPVPLVATYEPRHVLVSTTASKSILRTAADEIARAHEWALYFPSYEIVSAPYTRGAYFEPNLRSVTAAGVDHVMRLFLRHLYDIESAAAGLMSGYDVVCDEEALGR
ncbi:GSCFA domain-containing protein [Terricaulis sp.]|uniref:GSCFA domain-containing protein n=1 Tax=Terricaulis sp. TaxID=2768686 RepID=UPI003782E8CB